MRKDEIAQFHRDWVLKKLYDIQSFESLVMDYGDNKYIVRQNSKQEPVETEE